MVKNTMSQESVTNDKQLSTSKDKGMRFTSLPYTLFILYIYAMCVCVVWCGVVWCSGALSKVSEASG